MRRHWAILFGIAAVFLLHGTAFAIASDNQSILSGGTGLGGLFDEALFEIGTGLIQAANFVMFFMTIASFIMISLGMEDEKKLLWQIMLGLGLAWNFGGALLDMGFGSDSLAVGGTTQQFKFHLKSSGEFDILGNFVKNYIQNVIVPGSINILPICQKILIILAVIQGTWDLSFKFHGDKVLYLLSKVLSLGFFVFLMDKWIWAATALGEGFEMIGFLAGGITGIPAEQFSPDGIVNNAFVIFRAFWDQAEFSVSNLGLTLVNIIGMLAVLICLVLAAIEVTVAKIEFYTFALMTLPLLAFGVTEKFKFLEEKAIGAMFNLAIKLGVCTFILTIVVPFTQSFANDMKNATGLWTSLGVLLQAVLGAVMIFWITHSVPALASGLLNGQPSLGGSGMREMTTKAAAAPIAAAGMVREASKMAKQNGQGGVKGTLMELGKAAVNSRLPVQAFRGGRQRLRQLNDPILDRQRQELYEEAKLEAEAKDGKKNNRTVAGENVTENIAKSKAKHKKEQDKKE